MMIIPATHRFSAHCSKRGLPGRRENYNSFFIHKIDCIIVTQVGFCVISPWSLSRFFSNHKKALLRWLLHLHSNFQLIPSRGLPCGRGVYPVGVTDLRPYFTRIIDHNSVNVHRIPTKVGTEIRLNEPFKCAKCQPDWNANSCFMADFAKCAK